MPGSQPDHEDPRPPYDGAHELNPVGGEADSGGDRSPAATRNGQELFEHAPVSLWREDLSLVKHHMDALRAQGVEDFRAFFEEHPEEVLRCVGMVRILDVNRATLELHGAKSKDELRASLDKVFTEESVATVRELLIALADGATTFEAESVKRTLSGERLQILLKLFLDPQASDWDLVHVAITDLTRLRQTEEALRDSETRFRGLSEASFEAIFISEKGICLEQNQTAERMFGYSLSEAVGRQGTDWIAPEDRELVIGNMLTGYEEPFRATALRKDGSTFPAELRGRMMEYRGRQVRVTVLRDISERVRTEEALRASEELFRTLFRHASDGILTVDPYDARGPVIANVNETAALRHGYTRDEMRGMRITDLDAPEQRGEIRQRLLKIMSGEAVQFQTIHMHKDGGKIPLEVSAQLVEAGGKQLILSIERDIRERLKAEDERLALERQLQHAQKLESLGILAGGIAHDFNNILMAVLGNADLVLRDLPPDAPGRSNIGEIATAARRAADLTKQMLAYSGKGHFITESIRLNRFVEEMSHLLEVAIPKKTRITYNFARDLPRFKGDPTQIRQVIMNLITNAAEAIGEDSGVITLSTGVKDCDRACLDATEAAALAGLEEELPEGRYVWLEVADTGCGMDEGTRRKVFDPFFSTKFAGRGLGMAAVLGIVRGHRGTLRILSDPSGGTVLRVYFPTSAEASEDQAPVAEPRVLQDEWRGSGTVLVVDDEEVVRSIAAKMLQRIGFDVLEAGDGKEALEQLQRHGDEIRCVLLDLTMPQMDGEETVRELRRTHGKIRVVLSSGYTEQEVSPRFADLGIDGFIQKPYRLQALSDQMRELV